MHTQTGSKPLLPFLILSSSVIGADSISARARDSPDRPRHTQGDLQQEYSLLGRGRGRPRDCVSSGPPFVSALKPTIIVASLLITVWFLLVGYKLYRLGQPQTASDIALLACRLVQ